MKHKVLIAATAVAAAMSSGAMAASISITSLQGNWVNPSGSMQVEIVNSDPTSSINWGNSGSGYDFTAVDTPVNDPASPFMIGTFVHRNHDLGENTQPASVGLELLLTVTFMGESRVLSQVLQVEHRETPDFLCPDSPAPDRSDCADLVTLTLAGGSNSTKSAKRGYSFDILGFSTDGGSTITTSYQSPKFDANPVELYARIDIAVIPLPAAGWLLLGGLGGLAVRRRRRNAA